MSELDYFLGDQATPPVVELCGTCFRRVFFVGPGQTIARCERCGTPGAKPRIRCIRSLAATVTSSPDAAALGREALAAQRPREPARMHGRRSARTTRSRKRRS